MNSSFLIGTWILNLFRIRSTYRKKSPKTVPDDNIKRKFLQNGMKQHIWSVFFGPLSIFECIHDLIFPLYNLIFFIYNVLTTNWIVFFLHYRICLSQANKGVWSVFIKSQTRHTPIMFLKTYLFVNHFSLSKYWTQKFESSSEGLVNNCVREPRSG